MLKETTQEQDRPWKQIIETLFPQFMQFFFPDAHADIDWSRPPVFLDKELQQVTRGSATGRRYVDKLAKVWRIGGEEAWVLVHIEVQAQHDRGFPKRMFVYHYRLFDRYGALVASLVVLADESESWRPDEYRHSLWGVEAGLRFRSVKLLDYRDRWEELEKSRNPFSAVVMAHLKAQETKKDESERLRWKSILAKMLYKRGHKRAEALELLRFMDYILALPEELEIEFKRDLREYEEGQKVTYLSTFERDAMRRGLQQGLEQGQIGAARASVIDALETRFGNAPDAVAKRLGKISNMVRLRDLHRKAILAATLKEFERLLRA